MWLKLALLSLVVASEPNFAASKPPGGGGGGGGSIPCSLKRCYVVGNNADVVRTPSPGLLLAGGGIDQDAAMQWMIQKSGGGDFVVIRATGTDAYNPYIYALGPVDSVETMIINSRALAATSYVVDRLQKAEAIFIAGGSQDDYVNFWKDTPVETEINAAIARGVPVGGTSAGLAVLGQFSYSALVGSVDSPTVLANPYNSGVTLARDFIQAPMLGGLITDSHFVTRDRMGRLLGFMARLVKDGWTPSIKAVGIDEATALAVESNGDAMLFGSGAAYFLKRSGLPEVCVANTALTYTNVSVYKIQGIGAAFNLSTWVGAGGDSYSLSAQLGTLSSSDGSIY